MNFADGMKEVIRNLEPILAVADILTVERIELLGKLSDIDVGKMKKAIKAVKTLESHKLLFGGILNMSPAIEAVAKMERDIVDVHNMRDMIGVVAGSCEPIKAINELAPSIIKCNGMEPTLVGILDMKEDISQVLVNLDKIEDINATAQGMQNALQQMEDMYLKTKKLYSSIEEDKLEIARQAQLVQINLDAMKTIQNQLHDFQVKSHTIESDRKGYSRYESSENTLNLFIPQGKEGAKGEIGEGRRGQRGIPGTATNQGATGDVGRAGRDGDDYNINIFGMLREKSIYGNRPVGTSFLSLDESPCMIYFRKSNTLDDWTDGQPFGLSHGDFSISEIASAVLQLLNEKGTKNGNN